MTAQPPIIALAHMGSVDLTALDHLSDEVQDAFDREARWVTPLTLPPSAWNSSRHQFHSTTLLDVLAQVREPGWERLLGVVDVDLYVPELNFVFGEADRHRGVAVFSLARLHTPPGHEAHFRRRAATEAIHELGHTYGLPHCRNPGCVMWFSNTLAETDQKGTRLCEMHAAALARARAR
ncbi:MAG: archaemetzincin family Zn-dependent metalloprotease [Myxococcaceae bacterium]|nr:archaemetzincin family Zn-dependent metalloprotease [Myxococcaceae bacterium]MCI0673735.1 archaemetzincin family Zn-dependent metalloprotease [Myxococcaceae bacterium]